MKDDKKLREVLQQKISEIKKYPRTAQKEVEQIMADKFNVKISRTVDIFNYRDLIENMSYDMLYKLMIAIRELALNKYKDLDETELREYTYFNINEAKENGYSNPLKDEEEDFDLVFKDWHQTNVGMYSYITIFTDVNTIIKIRDYNRFRYNPETQRDLILVEKNGVPIVKADINEKSVKQMKEAMLDGSYFPVPSTININPELYDEYPIKIKSGDLIIDSKFKIDLIEGFHNYRAYTWAKDENPEWNYPCEFRLYLMNIEDANRYILQMDKKNHFKETQTKRIDTLSGVNYFIRTINTSSSFTLRGTIDDNMFLYLFKLISKMFSIDKINDAAKLIGSVTSKLNYVIEKTDHFDIPFNKEEWFVYLYLIKKSIDKNINFEKLIDLIGINSIFSDIQIKKEPLDKHYKILNKAISEVINNV